MTKNDMLAKIAAIITTLAETTEPGGFAVASMIYLGLGCDLQDYAKIIGVLESAGLVTSTPETVTLTTLGREKAVLLEEAMA